MEPNVLNTVWEPFVAKREPGPYQDVSKFIFVHGPYNTHLALYALKLQ